MSSTTLWTCDVPAEAAPRREKFRRDRVLGGCLLLVAIARRRREVEAWLDWARARFGARPHVAFSGVRAR
jgi:hypothetical protein